MEAQQQSMFEDFDLIEDLYDEDSLYLSTINWNAKFEKVYGKSFKRKIDLYCPSNNQLKGIKCELKSKGWLEKTPEEWPSKRAEFLKADMMIRIYSVFG